MTLTCPRCAQQIAVNVAANQYEIRVTCPRCGECIIIEVGAPGGIASSGAGPTEYKREPERS
jgi:transcription elongation factor Elf1